MLAVSGTREIGDFGDLLKALVPSGGALVTVIVLLIGLRFALGRTRSSPTKNFRIHVIMLIATLVGVLLVALALPPEDAIRDHGIRLLGIVISATIALSSTTILGNALAGVQLRSVSAFKPGDFLGIGDHFGRVTERGLFHTEIQTEDADLTTLPNLYLVSHPYKVVSASGTIISATVSLGYDAPRQQVEESLITAAKRIDLENPFVQVIDLGDFSVTYRIAGRLSNFEHILTYRSRLRMGILDHLHAAGIEIVSPSFMTTRALQPGHTVIPEVPGSVFGPEKEPVEEVIFDKAGRAAALEQKISRLQSLPHKIAEAKKLLREASEPDQPEWQRELESLEQEKESLTEEIADLEKEIRAHEEQSG